MTVGVELLLTHGADHSLRSESESTPLMFACFKSDDCPDPSVLIMLLSAGADPDYINMQGFTALIYAAQYGYKEGVTVLLNAGAHVNIQNIFGSTALHKAANRGSFAISELLLASGSQTSITDNTGMTPLDYALDNNHHDVCQLLLMNMDSSSPLPAVTDTIDTSSSLVTETIDLEQEEYRGAFSTLDQLRHALEYPLSPTGTTKHQADDEEETNKIKIKYDKN